MATNRRDGQGPEGEANSRRRSTLDLLYSIVGDTAELLRKEVELARQEIVEAVMARVKAAGALAGAAVLGLLALAFLAAAAAAALDLRMAPWASRLIVAGGLLALAGVLSAFGILRARRVPLAPTETKRTIKEDVQWARAQLRR
ncbi:MAG: phage holin family protein [Actinomycetota bacterium]